MTDDQKSARLVDSCRSLDRSFRFKGAKAYQATGALEFPRTLPDNFPYSYLNGTSSIVIPKAIQMAQCELLMSLYYEAPDDASPETREISKVSIEGVISLEFDAPKTSSSNQDSLRTGSLDAVQALLRDWIDNASNSNTFLFIK
jgi:hypothetical protein